MLTVKFRRNRKYNKGDRQMSRVPLSKVETLVKRNYLMGTLKSVLPPLFCHYEIATRSIS